MSGIIETIIEEHKPLTHGRVLCFCGREFGTDALHREHVTKFLEHRLSNRIRCLETFTEGLFALGNKAVEEDHINTATINVATMYRIMSNAYEETYRKIK